MERRARSPGRPALCYSRGAMAVLVLSLAALAAGPLVYRTAHRAGGGLALLDGFVIVAIIGLVSIHIVPEAIEGAGGVALAVALAGFLGPGLVELALRRAARRVHFATLALAVIGLVVHGFFDGVGLASSDPDSDGPSLLALAVLLHRLPVGIALWWLLAPSVGWRVAATSLAALGSATVIGFAAADAFASQLDSLWVGLCQALIAGSVLHVVIHRPAPVAPPSPDGRGQFYSGCGAVLGIVAVALLASKHTSHHAEPSSTFAAAFMSLALASAPALLVAYAVAGALQIAFPALSFRYLRGGPAAGRGLRGIAFGLRLPICSCGVAPFYRELATRSIPAAAALSFLVATPLLGLDAVFISLPLLGAPLTLLRIGAALGLALVVGHCVGRIVVAAPDAVPGAIPTSPGKRLPPLVRLRGAFAYGFGEMIDHTGPWLVLGFAIAALFAPGGGERWWSEWPPGADVLVATLVALPSYLGASATTPLAAVLLLHGLSPGAALALLLVGPAVNTTTYKTLVELHGRRAATAFVAAVALGALALGIVTNALWPAPPVALAAAPPPTSAVELASLAALVFCFALSVLRQGPRGFIGQILAPYKGRDHCHDADHEHCHHH